MFVNTSRVYKRPDFSLSLEKNFDARLIGRVPIYMVHIGRIIKLFEPRIKLRSTSEVSKCFIYRFLLGHRNLLLNVNYGVKIVMICM